MVGATKIDPRGGLCEEASRPGELRPSEDVGGEVRGVSSTDPMGHSVCKALSYPLPGKGHFYPHYTDRES